MGAKQRRQLIAARKENDRLRRRIEILYRAGESTVESMVERGERIQRLERAVSLGGMAIAALGISPEVVQSLIDGKRRLKAPVKWEDLLQ